MEVELRWIQVTHAVLRRPKLMLAALPLVSSFFLLLWLDFFNLGLAGAASTAEIVTGAPAAPGGAPQPPPRPYQPGDRVAWGADAGTVGAARRAASRPRPELPSSLRPSCSGAPQPAASPERRRSARPQVGASIAVHPPKFYSAAQFLVQLAACPAALEALSVYLVFTDDLDRQLFEEGMACLHPEVHQASWTPVTAREPGPGWEGLDVGATLNQKIAAYKKWQGIAYMMDLGPEEGPAYGLMMDAELLLFGSSVGGELCSSTPAWANFLSRLRAKDASKEWPAAQVSATLTVYDFGPFKKSGQDYDRVIINDNAKFANTELDSCTTPGCEEVKRQVNLCLYSWWTEIPWMRLSVAGSMMVYLAGGPPPKRVSWQEHVRQVRFQRFEHIGYQQWTAMYEGFRFRDVTNITGEAKWGSYMEDPLPGARLAELEPLWISGQALQRVEEGSLPALSSSAPPLLVFHADQGKSRANRDENRARWRALLQELLRGQNRTDYKYINDL